MHPAYALRGIRRHGFHGLSYSALVRTMPEVAACYALRLLGDG